MLNKRHLFINSYSAFLFKFLFPYVKERKCPFRGYVQTIEQRTFFIIKIARKCAIDSFHIVSAHAPNCLVPRYRREITLEGATFIRLPIRYTMEYGKDEKKN